jgi:hypothetical protein
VILFVGERRSDLAKRKGVRWEDGRLAAKQLFDALVGCGIDPKAHAYVNLFEPGGLTRVRRHDGPIVGLGRLVQRTLTANRIPHVRLVHPAARGAIRRKEVYAKHVAETLREHA